ncbi:hypothetical protein [Mycoplasmopsis alligatoris]|uniref:Uncharacterized protein n=1 Tax=Mycoplasmopsis alligatoris A21JP2 TaxID=747682 RepID=D4XVA6_9BACT|nr:hypothetical protein [Mycoplasmopsis alligatoris]EFF41736.1 hypothetical protein MALL_0083 [Mycoplasmopsis alligatoris A21JP2]
MNQDLINQDNNLITKRREELKQLHEHGFSENDNHKIDPSLIKYNKHGQQKLMNINQIKWTKQQIIIKSLATFLVLVVITLLFVAALYIGQGV